MVETSILVGVFEAFLIKKLGLINNFSLSSFLKPPDNNNVFFYLLFWAQRNRVLKKTNITYQYSNEVQSQYL